MTKYTGINMDVLTTSTPAWPFLDIKKQSSEWSAINNLVDANIVEDANGYPTSMTLSDATVATGFQANMFVASADPAPPNCSAVFNSGTYVLLWNGAGTCTLGDDAQTPVSGGTSSDGRHRTIYTVAPGAGSKISVLISSVPVTNVSVVWSPGSTSGGAVGNNEQALFNGEFFAPDFLAKVRPFKAFRFMQWQNTTGSGVSAWTDRTPLTFHTWGPINVNHNYSGPPVEVMLQLCNEIGADCWFNIPSLATDSFVTSFATFALSDPTYKLRAPLKLYVEYANEKWNYPYAGMQVLAAAVFPGLTGDSTGLQLSYGAYREAHNADLCKAIWTGSDSSRLVMVGAGQGGFISRNRFLRTTNLNSYNGSSPTLLPVSGVPSTHYDVFTTNGYWGYDVPAAWSADVDFGLAKISKEIMVGGLLPSPASATTNNSTANGNNTLNFATTQSTLILSTAGVVPGMTVINITAPTSIPANTTVLSATPTTVVMSANAAGSGVSNGDLIAFDQPNTAGGTAAALTLTSDKNWGNGAIPATPANQTIIQMIVSPTLAANTSATLAVDGGTPFPILQLERSPLGQTGGSSYWGFNNTRVIVCCFTNQVAPCSNVAVQGISKANPCVVTVNSGYWGPNATVLPGSTVSLAGVGGMTQVNGNTYTVLSVDQYSNHITLSLDSSGFTTYTSGGTLASNGVVPGAWLIVPNIGYAKGMVQQEIDAHLADYNANVADGVSRLVVYEGGQNFIPYAGSLNILTGPVIQQLMYLIVNRSAIMTDAYVKWLNGFEAVNSDLVIQYALTQVGFWGALENILQTTTPKYTGITQALLAGKKNLKGEF